MIGAVGPLLPLPRWSDVVVKGVPNPMSPQQARAQVIDAGKEMVRDPDCRASWSRPSSATNHAPTTTRPFQSKLAMQFWMPGASRSHPVDPATVYTALRQTRVAERLGPSFPPVAMQKDGVVAVLDVYNADPPAVAMSAWKCAGNAVTPTTTRRIPSIGAMSPPSCSRNSGRLRGRPTPRNPRRLLMVARSGRPAEVPRSGPG